MWKQRRRRREVLARPGRVEEPLVSRRRVLGLGGAAVAGAAGAAVAGAGTAGATPGSMQYGTSNDAGTDQTTLTSSASITLYGTNTGGGSGVEGQSASGTGAGGASGSGSGVIGDSATGVGVFGTSELGIGLRGKTNTNQGNGVQLQLDPGNSSGPLVGGQHFNGQFWVDSSGRLYQCVTSGTPGTWKDLTTGSKLVTLPAPVRVFDSRAGQPNGGGSTQGALTFTAAPPAAAFRDVNVSQNAVGGAVVVPPGASAVLMNLAVVSISGVGALAVCAHGATQPGTANINWFAGGQVLSNAVTSAVDTNRHVDVVIVAGAGASTQFILDVVGYYL